MSPSVQPALGDLSRLVEQPACAARRQALDGLTADVADLEEIAPLEGGARHLQEERKPALVRVVGRYLSPHVGLFLTHSIQFLTFSFFCKRSIVKYSRSSSFSVKRACIWLWHGWQSMAVLWRSAPRSRFTFLLCRARGMRWCSVSGTVVRPHSSHGSYCFRSTHDLL